MITINRNNPCEVQCSCIPCASSLPLKQLITNNNDVCVGESLSQRFPVTQGYVLSARLFTVYTYPLASMFNKPMFPKKMFRLN